MAIPPPLFLRTPVFAGFLSSLGLLPTDLVPEVEFFRGGGEWGRIVRNVEKLQGHLKSLLVDSDVRKSRAFPGVAGVRSECDG